MQRKSIMTTIAALCLGLTGPVYAQSEGDNPIHSNAMSQGGLNTGANRPHPPGARYTGQNAAARDRAAERAYGGGTDERAPAYDRRNDRTGARDSRYGRTGGYDGSDRRGGYDGSDRRGGYDGRDGRGGYDGRYGRGAGPEHSFYRGGRLPAQYRSRQYVVDDWRGHHLSAPPRGYQWVQTGADYVLVAIATGIIAQLLLSN
jgi:Ni/Co efflux regulator RcnB